MIIKYKISKQKKTNLREEIEKEIQISDKIQKKRVTL